MLLSVVIPAYNERQYIVEVLGRIRKQNRFPKEIIIVDDGSRDGTAAILRALARTGEIRLIEHPCNRGKGAALRSGLQEARGDIILFQDADLELDPADYPRLIKPILSGNAEVVYGSRFLGRKNKVPWSNLAANRALTLATNYLFGAALTDEATGYKVFRRDVILPLSLRSNGFEICPEITAKLLKAGYKIVEVPVSYFPRNAAGGKKLNWLDGVVAVVTLLRYRLAG